MFETIETIVTEINSKNGPGLSNGYQISYDRWSWLHLRMSFLTNAFRGLIFSILLSLLILILTTQNIYISLISVYCITSIIMCMMSMMYFQGWSFGMVESTSLIIYVGISVDYVVHIAHQYIHGISEDRIARMNHAYK
jgi:predicted RND superfamily exporter protein